MPRTHRLAALLALVPLLLAAAAGDALAAKKKKGGGKKPADTAAPDTAAPEIDKDKEAKRHFDSGNLFYESGDFLAAAAEFLVAYDLVPKNSLLYNAGRAYEEAKDAGKAAEMYKRYLKGSDVANRDEVEERLEKLSAGGNRTITVTTKPDGASIWVDLRAGSGARTPYTVSLEMGPHKLFIEKKGFKDVANEFNVTEESEGTTVEIELTATRGHVAALGPDGADVFVDGEKVGTLPLDAVGVATGTHEVLIRVPGKEGTFRTIDVGEGETVVVRGAAGGSALMFAGIGLVGVGVAAGVTSGVFGFLALSTHNTLARCADLGTCTMSEAETDLAVVRGKRDALVSDIAWIAGAALAGTGIALFLVSLGGKKSAAPHDEYARAPGRLRVDAVGIVPGPGGGAVTLAGGF